MPDATPPLDGKQDCPAPDCDERVRKHQFACPVDWVRLPAELRRAINEGYRRDWGAWAKAADAAITWYGQHPVAAS